MIAWIFTTVYLSNFLTLNGAYALQQLQQACFSLKQPYVLGEIQNDFVELDLTLAVMRKLILPEQLSSPGPDSNLSFP